MRKLDLTITEYPRQAGHEVVGRVTVGPPLNGRQQARVFWVVNTLDAVEVIKAMQENAVIAGSLGGEWGRVGDIVSEAAAQGIEELFKKSQTLAHIRAQHLILHVIQPYSRCRVGHHHHLIHEFGDESIYRYGGHC